MIEWEQGQYTSESARVGRFTLSICWDSLRSQGSKEPPWVASALGFRLTKKYEDPAAAKRAAERFARKALREALAAFGDEPEGSP